MGEPAPPWRSLTGWVEVRRPMRRGGVARALRDIRSRTLVQTPKNLTLSAVGTFDVASPKVHLITHDRCYHT